MAACTGRKEENRLRPPRDRKSRTNRTARQGGFVVAKTPHPCRIVPEGGDVPKEFKVVVVLVALECAAVMAHAVWLSLR